MAFFEEVSLFPTRFDIKDSDNVKYLLAICNSMGYNIVQHIPLLHALVEAVPADAVKSVSGAKINPYAFTEGTLRLQNINVCRP